MSNNAFSVLASNNPCPRFIECDTLYYPEQIASIPGVNGTLSFLPIFPVDGPDHGSFKLSLGPGAVKY
jgi:hypothetical protein